MFQMMHQDLKKKVEKEEKLYGHACTADDILFMWKEELSKRAMEIWKIEKDMQKSEPPGKLDKELQAEVDMVLVKLRGMQTPAGTYQQRKDIMNRIGRVDVGVARKTTLTPAQEELRLKLQWQDFDSTMYNLTLEKDDEVLGGYVCRPKEWRDHLEDLVICFEDEVGMWLGCQCCRTSANIEDHQHAKRRKKLKSRTVEGQEKIAELEKEPQGGMHQQRGVEGKGEDKRRITVLHRMLLDNVVQTEGKRKMPSGRLSRTAVVLPGNYLNVDYFDIGEDGHAYWNRDWSIEVDGDLKEYAKGEPIGNLGAPLQAVKKAFPELCKQFLIMQQPAAFRDTVIVAWCMEDLHEMEKYVFMQHDLVGCQLTEAIKQLRWMLMQPDTDILPEMTACSQLTDIIVARPAKACARNAIPGIRQWLKMKAKMSGKAVSFGNIYKYIEIYRKIYRNMYIYI